jgi:hypothetical protein
MMLAISDTMCGVGIGWAHSDTGREGVAGDVTGQVRA